VTQILIIGGRAHDGGPLEPESEVDIDPDTIETLPSGEERFERFRRQVEDHSFATYAYDNKDGCLVLDVQTANLLVQVAQALSPERRAKFLTMDLGRMVEIAWKAVS